MNRLRGRAGESAGERDGAATAQQKRWTAINTEASDRVGASGGVEGQIAQVSARIHGDDGACRGGVEGRCIRVGEASRRSGSRGGAPINVIHPVLSSATSDPRRAGRVAA